MHKTLQSDNFEGRKNSGELGVDVRLPERGGKNVDCGPHTPTNFQSTGYLSVA
jgi:hypothetical protein